MTNNIVDVPRLKAIQLTSMDADEVNPFLQYLVNEMGLQEWMAEDAKPTLLSRIAKNGPGIVNEDCGSYSIVTPAGEKLTVKLDDWVISLDGNTSVSVSSTSGLNTMLALMGEEPVAQTERVAQQLWRKKPVEIEALQYNDTTATYILGWIESETLGRFDMSLYLDDPDLERPESGVSIDPRDGRLVIATLEGFHWVDNLDFVIRGIAGEFYPCKPDIFHDSYEEVM